MDDNAVIACLQLQLNEDLTLNSTLDNRIGPYGRNFVHFPPAAIARAAASAHPPPPRARTRARMTGRSSALHNDDILA
ncbi:hypothetical protein EVAR_29524_1 [Eumeta japonica]|uniref:Uncharacterized protein n=1 Tax=Eumeta variegata TaxID=151549 RepID=A0A4C1WFJ0_EUMVA|nr:hypothetical protein EVAR_29524_1 [Eumeta japonica]